MADLSIEIAAGDVVGLVGLSGSSKSTLVKFTQRLHGHADAILVIDRGRIVERGTHRELLERAGTMRACIVTRPTPFVGGTDWLTSVAARHLKMTRFRVGANIRTYSRARAAHASSKVTE